jgi:hypothetical protein
MPQVKGLKELRLPVRQQQKKAAVRDDYRFHPDGTSWLPDFFYRIMTDMMIYKENRLTYDAD